MRYDRPTYPPFTYPTPHHVDQTDDYHGTVVADPFRWMEDLDGDELKAWIEEENKLTESFLTDIAVRPKIQQRVTQLWRYEKKSAPGKRAGRYFYSIDDGTQEHGILYTASSLDAEPEVLLDPNGFSDDGSVVVSGQALSFDGSLLAYSLSVGGSDWVEWHVRDVATGEDLPDVIERVKFSGLSFTHDNKGFYYSAYDSKDATSANEGHRVYYHVLGTKQSEDRLVYERPDLPKSLIGASITRDGKYLVVSVTTDSSGNSTLYLADLTRDDTKFTKLIGNLDARYGVIGNDGPIFWIQTDLDAPNSKVIAVDKRKPAAKNWVELIPERPEPLQGVGFTNGQFVAHYLKDVQTSIEIVATDGSPVRQVELPGIGTASLGGPYDDTEAFISFTNAMSPNSVYRYDMETGATELWFQPSVAADPDEFDCRQVFYSSKDGTKVPMMLCHRKGIELDGSHPTYLYGYGGFNVSLLPAYSSTAQVWMELGGVFAIANIRGGGEYGKAWHEAAIKTKRQNAFDDFIAAAEWLIDQGYTSPERLSISGGSNGGCLVGSCMTQRPDLFAAALPAVGVLDMLRFHKATIGWAWTTDYGCADDPDEFEALYAYSPLHNLVPGTAYPATMVTTADCDDRVVPWHSFKFAATLQETHAGDAPVFIRVETKSGHGAVGATKQIEEVTDKLSFLVRTLGMEEALSDWEPPAVPMPIELAYTSAQIGSGYHGRMAMSPDGGRLIYWIERTPDEDEGDGDPAFGQGGAPGTTRMVKPYILDLATGKSTQLGPDGSTSWRPWWSPDGRQIAYYCDEGGTANVWVRDVAAGTDRRVSDARIKAKLWVGDEPYWSADGTEVFVPLYPGVADDPEAEAQTRADANAEKDAIEAGSRPKAKGPKVKVFRAGSETEGHEDEAGSGDPIRRYIEREGAGLAAIDMADGSVRMIAAPDTEPYPSVLQRSPSGRWISYLSVFHPRPEEGDEESVSFKTTAHDLAVVPAKGVKTGKDGRAGKAKVVVLAEAIPLSNWRDYYLDSYIWHPTKDRLLWVSRGELWTSECTAKSVGEPEQLAKKLGAFTTAPLTVTADGKAVVAGVDPIDLNDYHDERPQKIAVVPFDGSKPTTFRLPAGVVFLGVVEQARNTAWAAEPKTITIAGERTATAERVLMRADLAKGKLRILWEAAATVRFVGCDGDPSTIIGVYEDFNTPSDLYRFDADGERIERLTTVEPRLAGIRFGSVERFITKVPQPDGTMTEATSLMLLPPGAKAGDKLPCLLFFYPGSSARGASSFGGGTPAAVPASVFVSRGYAVLLADAPIGPEGPQGGHPLQDLVDVLTPQVYRAAELGYIDLDRVAISGQSYGGYGTVATISGTNLFRAAIATDGTYDLVGGYVDFWSEGGQGRMGTHPWANQQRYLTNSPYARADRIQTPLLLIHGEEDKACPVEEAHKMFKALKRLSRPVQLAVYEGGGHVVFAWALANAVDATERMVEFLDRHLARPAPPTDAE